MKIALRISLIVIAGAEIARHARLTPMNFERENFPELGENDWDRIVEYIRDQTSSPDERFREAYQLLSDRAENDA